MKANVCYAAERARFDGGHFATFIALPIPPHPRRLVDAIRALIEKGNEHE